MAVMCKRYFGAHDEARLVTSVEGGVVHWMGLPSMQSGHSDIAEFEAWAASSARRNYTHESGERRIKVATTEAEAEVGDYAGREEGVVWVNLEDQTTLQWSSLVEWQAWRAGAV